MPALAIPVKLHLDPTVLVAINLLAFGTGDRGGLTTEHSRFFVAQGRAVKNVPGRGEKAVAITLNKVISQAGCIVVSVFFEYARLSAFMADFCQ
ncbi:hypothetical protein D3C87_1107450 [compost metagenome]